MTTTFEPSLRQILSFCAEDPVERVFLEDVARRGLGRFVALGDGVALTALCHVGVNVVPSGRGCEAFGAGGRVRTGADGDRRGGGGAAISGTRPAASCRRRARTGRASPST